MLPYAFPSTRRTARWTAWVSGVGRWAWVCVVLVPLLGLRAARAEADYARDVKPLLKARCYACHGALKQRAGLRLDTVESIRRGGESGAAIALEAPEKSLVLRRVAAVEVAERMPPEHEGEPFAPAQVELLRAWIASGAPGVAGEEPESDPKSHWAFRPPIRCAVPRVVNAGWVRNPIDAFVARQHEVVGLKPQPEAARWLLVRRLYLDLLGVPPSAGDLRRIVAEAEMEAEAENSSDWYDRLVTRLLEDPRHGERWARHWMDIWRYSDGWGLGDQHRNSQKHIWHWRDWIVESLNHDLPYDEMLRQMLAADETHPTDLGALRATGFLVRNYFLFNRNQWLDETVEHVSKGFLGLTLNCAKCHDHKYDPIAQADYYRMRAFFEPYHARLDVLPGEPDLGRDGLPRAYDRTLDPPTYRFVRGQENVPDKSAILSPGVPGILSFAELSIRPVSLPPEAWQPERRPWVFDAYRRTAVDQLERTKASLARLKRKPVAGGGAPTDRDRELRVAEAEVAVAEAEVESVEKRSLAMKERWERESGVDASGASVARAAAVRAERALGVDKARLVVTQLELRLARATTEGRAAVEKELAAARAKREQAEKALGSSVTPDEGFAPLLGAAWTPTRFLDSTKDDPSFEFPPTSTGRRSALAAWITDSRNPLTARVAVNHVWNRHFGTPLVASVFDFGRKNGVPAHVELLDWLACELVESGWSLKHLHRLIVTSATYRLNSSVAGAEENLAKDPDNLRWWRRTPIRLEAQAIRDAILAHAGRLDGSVGGPPVSAADQESSRRRSLYFYHSNNERNPLLAIFDDATVKECYRREQSIVPQQALALMNSRLAQDGAGWIAARLGRELAAGADDKTGDEAFVREAFGVLLGFAPGKEELSAARAALASWRNLADVASASAPASEIGMTARKELVWSLLNHHDFVTLR